MTDDLEYISEFIKEKTGKHKFEPDTRLSKFKRRIFWMNFFKFGWFHFNVYYLTAISLISGSIGMYIHFSNQNTIDCTNNFHNPDRVVIDTTEADSLSNFKHVTSKDTTNKKSTRIIGNEGSTTKEMNPAIKNNRIDTIKKDTMNTFKDDDYKETTIKPHKDTLKIIVQDTVIKKVKIRVIDTLRNN